MKKCLSLDRTQAGPRWFLRRLLRNCRIIIPRNILSIFNYNMAFMFSLQLAKPCALWECIDLKVLGRDETVTVHANDLVLVLMQDI